MRTLCVVQEAGNRERMWRVLHAVLRGVKHMFATNRKGGRRGSILVLDSAFGGATHGTVWWLMEERVSLEVMHVCGRDMKEYQRAGLHHEVFGREKGVVEWGVCKWMIRR